MGMVAIRNREMHLYKVIVTNLSDATAEKQSSSKLVFSRSGERHLPGADVDCGRHEETGSIARCEIGNTRLTVLATRLRWRNCADSPPTK